LIAFAAVALVALIARAQDPEVPRALRHDTRGRRRADARVSRHRACRLRDRPGLRRWPDRDRRGKAAWREGAGVEIDGKLVEVSRENAKRAGVAELAQFVERDVLLTDLSRATVVTIYLLPSLIDRLQPKFLDELRPGTRIVSHAFAMKGWNPDRVEKVHVRSPHLRQGDESTIFLWIVPAQARGFWRSGDLSLRVHQNFQQIDVEATAGGSPVTITEAKLEATSFRFRAPTLRFRGQVGPKSIDGEMTRAGRALRVAFAKGS
jgi:hypothetical protein